MPVDTTIKDSDDTTNCHEPFHEFIVLKAPRPDGWLRVNTNPGLAERRRKSILANRAIRGTDVS